MLSDELLIVTRVARPGLRVRGVFRECLAAHVQALPYCDGSGRITGRVALKHIVNSEIVPAHVVGDCHATFERMERRLPEIFGHRVDGYVQEPHPSVGSEAQLMKALTMMEHHDTSYLFVVDAGVYRGTLTHPGHWAVDGALRRRGLRARSRHPRHRPPVICGSRGRVAARGHPAQVQGP